MLNNFFLLVEIKIEWSVCWDYMKRNLNDLLSGLGDAMKQANSMWLKRCWIMTGVFLCSVAYNVNYE